MKMTKLTLNSLSEIGASIGKFLAEHSKEFLTIPTRPHSRIKPISGWE